MKREIVKELLRLSDEALEYIDLEGLVIHKEVARWYANGGDVMLNGTIIPHPIFNPLREYEKHIPEIEILGVKVRCNPPLTNVKHGQRVYMLDPRITKGYAQEMWLDSIQEYRPYPLLQYPLLRKFIFEHESDVKAVVKALGWV